MFDFPNFVDVSEPSLAFVQELAQKYPYDLGGKNQIGLGSKCYDDNQVCLEGLASQFWLSYREGEDHIYDQCPYDLDVDQEAKQLQARIAEILCQSTEKGQEAEGIEEVKE